MQATLKIADFGLVICRPAPPILLSRPLTRFDHQVRADAWDVEHGRDNVRVAIVHGARDSGP